MPKMSEKNQNRKNIRKGLIKPFLYFFILGLVLLMFFPGYRGFYSLSFSFSLIFLAIYTPGNLLENLKGLSLTLKKRRMLFFGKGVLLFIVLLILGSFSFLPVFNLAAPKELELSEPTLLLLKRIEEPVSLNAYVADERGLVQIRYLLDLYSKNQPKITTNVTLAYGKSEQNTDKTLEVAKENSILITSGTFREIVSPVRESSINASLQRLISPIRLIYNLQGEGERAATDESPRGLSLWSDYLEGRKIYVEDYFWNQDEPLPQGATVMLIGPRMPLGDTKDLALKQHLQNGGKAIMLLDPLVASVDSEFFHDFGIDLGDGLVVDPDSSLTGTESAFLIIKDLPAHPITLGLTQPIIAPIAGAILPKGQEKTNAPVPLLSEGGVDIDNSLNESPKAQKSTAFLGHTWALAQSGKESFLETDLNAVRDGIIKVDQNDPMGPHSIATASSIEGGGRLVLVADSDLASNAYITFAGNAEFLSNMLFWLEGAEEDLGVPMEGFVLIVNNFLARVFFFVPVIIWPLVVLCLWGRYYLHRKRTSA
jgi:hypothetical protein